MFAVDDDTDSESSSTDSEVEDFGEDDDTDVDSEDEAMDTLHGAMNGGVGIQNKQVRYFVYLCF